jgi:hypothetical protein
MGDSPRTKGHQRRWRIVGAVLAVVTLTVIAMLTGGFGIVDSKEQVAESKERLAQDRCESDVLKRLPSPSTAQLSTVETATSGLDPDSRDLFPLMLNDPLKGVDHSRITVWNVSGVVTTQSDSWATIHDRFDCRAYFVDGNLADTLVLLDHSH